MVPSTGAAPEPDPPRPCPPVDPDGGRGGDREGHPPPEGSSARSYGKNTGKRKEVVLDKEIT